MRRVMLLTLLLAVAAARAETLPEPVLQDRAQLRQTYGDATNVRLLLTVFDDEDPMAHEQAVRDLGRTHNIEAIAHIRKAIQDSNVDVRCAAAAAAAEFSADQAGDIVIAALADADRRTTVAALTSAASMKLIAAVGAVTQLLARDDPIVQAAALEALTSLGRAAPAASLIQLAGNASTTVRLRTAENALLLGNARAVLNAIRVLSRDRAASVRAAALACLGKFTFATSLKAVSAAAASDDPKLRRGALWACLRARQTDRILPFLSDRSPMVRLAAIRAAGELKVAACTDRLFALMLDAPLHDMSHEAARLALRQIGTPAVASKAAKLFQDRITDSTRVEGKSPTQSGGTSRSDLLIEYRAFGPIEKRLVRNTRSCLWLLGELVGKDAFDTMLATVPKLHGDSPVADALVEALGKIGDPRAVAPLTAFLEHCKKLAPRWMAEQLKMQPQYVPYDDRVTAEIVGAMGRLKATGTVKTIIYLARVRIRELRLSHSPLRACRVLSDLITDQNRPAVHGVYVQMLADPNDAEMQFLAAKKCGRLKIATAVEALNDVLKDLRPNKLAIAAAAWAIGQITSKTPPLTDPVAKEGGDWIIRKTRK